MILSKFPVVLLPWKGVYTRPLVFYARLHLFSNNVATFANLSNYHYSYWQYDDGKDHKKRLYSLIYWNYHLAPSASFSGHYFSFFLLLQRSSLALSQVRFWMIPNAFVPAAPCVLSATQHAHALSFFRVCSCKSTPVCGMPSCDGKRKPSVI